MRAKTALKRQTVAGFTLTLVGGVRYIASRPFASRDRKVYPVTITAMIGAPAKTPTVTIKNLTYAQADALVNAFNNGDMSFDGRVW